jgi:uncharacterized peroxidase-related enzyme
MAHIDLPKELPGITAGFAFRPETAKPMRELAHILLFASGSLPESSLTSGERELIATFVSARNRTTFCELSHGASAAAHLGDEAVVKQVKVDFTQAAISPRLKALLAIAGKVQQDGKLVTAADVEAARREGASDLDIHDTVLIAAAFCMYNRYVDGLGTWQPENPEMYAQMGKHLAEQGYATPSTRETAGTRETVGAA